MPLPDAAEAASVLVVRSFQHDGIKQRVRQELLQARVLCLQRLDLPRVRYVQTAILRLPAEKCSSRAAHSAMRTAPDEFIRQGLGVLDESVRTGPQASNVGVADMLSRSVFRGVFITRLDLI